METIKIKTCWICGKKFPVKIRDDGLILTPCFHSYIRRYYFPYWGYRIKSLKGDLFNKKNSDVIYKNKLWKFLGYTTFQRWIIYNIWDFFHRGKLEYWECPNCCKEGEKNA
jgi:hypothetical protein